MKSRIYSFDPTFNQISQLDFVRVHKSSELVQSIQQDQCDVLVLNGTTAKIPELFSLLSSWNDNLVRPFIALVIDPEDKSVAIQEIITQLRIDSLVFKSETISFDQKILQVVEKASEARQKFAHYKLAKEQASSLQNFYNELEARVESKQQALMEVKKKSFLAQTRWELTKQALILIQQSEAFSELEDHLFKILGKPLSLDSVKIFFQPQSQNSVLMLKRQKIHSLQAFELFNGTSSMGHLLFIRKLEQPFQKDEIEFLMKISETVSLALTRLARLDQAESIQKQWQTTFNSISDPIAIINSHYQVIQFNQAYKQFAKSDLRLEKKCYQVLFERDKPCPQCKLGSKFNLHLIEQNTSIDVISQKMFIQDSMDPVYMHFYQDRTDKINMQNKIIESAKLAELGTIGSSIAHELNNPLGGMLSFTQLSLSDLKPDDERRKDLTEIESAIRRSKEIVQNLLTFSRLETHESKQDILLKEIIERVVKLTEIQSRSRGIEIKLHDSSNLTDPLKVHGQKNWLTQAFQIILQLIVLDLLQGSQKSKSFQGMIEVKISKKQDLGTVSILYNGALDVFQTEFRLSLARQIFQDHGAEMDFHSPTKGLSSIEIRFIRPVFNPS